MCDENKIVRFSSDVICSKPEKTDIHLAKNLKVYKTLMDLAQEKGKITFVSDDIETSDTPEGGKYRWALVDLKKKFYDKPLFYLAEYDRETCLYDGYLAGDLDHITGGIEKKASLKGKEFYEKYNKLKEILGDSSEAAPVKVKKPEVPAPSTAKEIAEAMTHEIYENLLIDNWCSEAGFARFIKVIGTRLKEIREAGDTRYYVETPARYAVVNTGLINGYKEDVYVMYRWNEKANTYVPYTQVKGREDWLTNGFTPEQSQTKLKPLRFLEPSDSLGDIDASAIDIPTDAYKHIIDDNRERMESVIGTADFSREMVADRIRGAVSTCIKMLERDPGYAKPYYTTTMGLSWMLPLHIKSGLNAEPEFGLILARRNGWYEVKTAIPYSDETKDSLTATSLYGKNW